MNIPVLAYIILFMLSPHCLLAMSLEKPICHLAYLPRDVQDLIASYLTFKDRETKTELIARTQMPSPDPEKYFKYMPSLPFEHGWGGQPASIGFSPDQSKIIFVRSYYNFPEQFIQYDAFDIKKQRIIRGEFLGKKLVKDTEGSREAVALSSDGMFLAEIRRKKIDEYQLRVMNTKTGDTKCFILPEKFDTCSFNKQGTQVIITKKILLIQDFPTDENDLVLPIDVTKLCNKYLEPQHCIFTIATEKEHREKSQPRLDDYFRQRAVCKKLRNSYE